MEGKAVRDYWRRVNNFLFLFSCKPSLSPKAVCNDEAIGFSYAHTVILSFAPSQCSSPTAAWYTVYWRQVLSSKSKHVLLQMTCPKCLVSCGFLSKATYSSAGIKSDNTVTLAWLIIAWFSMINYGFVFLCYYHSTQFCQLPHASEKWGKNNVCVDYVHVHKRIQKWTISSIVFQYPLIVLVSRSIIFWTSLILAKLLEMESVALN